MNKILIIQTAFIGDVVLATVLVEKIHSLFPHSKIDFLLRKGNEGLLAAHPKISEVLIWDKRHNKNLNLAKIILKVRSRRYDLVVNVHRFASSGIITMLSSAVKKSGFDKNPFSFSYDYISKHEIGNNVHETQRNLSLIDFINEDRNFKPQLYFSKEDEMKTKEITTQPYVVMAPASVWFTKQLPLEKWTEIVGKIPASNHIYLVGAGNDMDFCEKILRESNRKKMTNLAGKLSFLESAALMKHAEMNFVNDSAPLHIASAVNAPTTAIFCSTIPGFGFGPLSDKSKIFQFDGELICRPCGLHGWKSCPKGHFKCAREIKIPDNLL